MQIYNFSMDPDEYDRMIETGHRPGVQVVGYAILFGLVGACAATTYLIVTVFSP